MSADRTPRVGVLGPLAVTRGDRELDLGPAQRRVLLLRLLLARGRAVSSERLCADLWGDRASRRSVSSLHAHISRLRGVLEPGRERRGQDGLLVTEGAGYALRLPDEACDTFWFHRAVADAQRALDRCAAETARREADRALDWWRGEPLPEVADRPFAAGEVARLQESLLRARQTRIAALLQLREYDQAATLAQELAIEQPTHEAAWGLAVRALYLLGRPAEALRWYEMVRRHLDQELGLEPGPELRALQLAVLRHDTALIAPPEPTATDPYAGRHADRPAPPAALAAPGSEPAETASPAGEPGAAARNEPPATGTGHPAAGPPDRPPLPGRARELRRLTALLCRARQDRAAWAIVSGAAGTGKTRLAEELSAVAQARGVTTVWTRQAVDAATSAPFWTGTQLLRALLPAEELARLLPAVRRLVRHPVADSGAPDHAFERLTLVTEIADRLVASLTGPTLWVVDDAQWIDPDSRDLLAFLAVHARDVPLTVVVNARDPEAAELGGLPLLLARQGATHLGLGPLPRAASRDVVRDWLADHLPAALPGAAALADELHLRSGGHPFVLTELLRGCVDRHGRITGDLPAIARLALLTPLAELSEDAQELLEVAAITGGVVDGETLARVAGRAPLEVLELMDEAQATGSVVRDARHGGHHTWRLTPPVLADAILRRLPSARRQQLESAARAAAPGPAPSGGRVDHGLARRRASGPRKSGATTRQETGP